MSATLIEAVDGLYRRAVSAPGEIGDAELAEWIEEISFELVADTGKDRARAVRRAARNARRLARYWGSSNRDPSDLADWRNGVDEVLGGGGWRPQLDLARYQLEEEPSPESFQTVKEWFRAVHFSEWMEGVAYEEWLEESGSCGD